jgi:hypothetical protein
MQRANTLSAILVGILGPMSCVSSKDDVGDGTSTSSIEALQIEAALTRVRLREDRLLEEGRSSVVTSSADDADGSHYVTGVFSGTIAIGAVLLESQGGKDIFIARLRPDGTVIWAQAIGSKNDEGGPKVTFSDGRVKLVGMTSGPVDCGQGPLNTWSTETFFLCTFGADGEPINGASFPTGRR